MIVSESTGIGMNFDTLADLTEELRNALLIPINIKVVLFSINLYLLVSSEHSLVPTNPFRLCLPSRASAPLSQTRLFSLIRGYLEKTLDGYPPSYVERG